MATLFLLYAFLIFMATNGSEALVFMTGDHVRYNKDNMTRTGVITATNRMASIRYCYVIFNDDIQPIGSWIISIYLTKSYVLFFFDDG